MAGTNRKTLVVVTIIVLSIICLYLFYSGFQKSSEINTQAERLAELESKTDQLSKSVDDLTLQNDGLNNLLSDEKLKAEEAARQAEILKAREERLQKAVDSTKNRLDKERSLYEVQRRNFLDEMQKTKKAKSTLEEKLRQAIASKDVVISNLQGKLTVNVASKILFKSGSATLISEGKKVLDKLALALENEVDQMVEIEGHTDNIPIKTVKFPTNWELSASRAIAAVRYLNEVCKIPPDQLRAVAQGQHRPIAPNDTKENRAKNRRIEIILTPRTQVDTPQE